MANPYQVICLSAVAPDLFTSSYGPFVVNACPSLAEIADALHNSACDALLVEVKTPADYDKLLAWPGLAHAVMDSAVVIVAPEPRVRFGLIRGDNVNVKPKLCRCGSTVIPTEAR